MVFGVKPTFRFYCIMRSFQLIKVLVCLEETALVFLEETVLRPSRLRTGKQQHNSSCCCNGGGNPPSSSRQLLLQQVNPPRHEKGNCCCNVHGNLLSRFITQAPRHRNVTCKYRKTDRPKYMDLIRHSFFQNTNYF